MTHHIPNAITLLNLVFGTLALVSVFAGQPLAVGGWLAAAALADFADGAVARALGVSSPLGQQLDSLADMVSFGVVPGAILYSLLGQHFQGGAVGLHWGAVPAFALTAFSALRLGKFNLDTRQTYGFIGLPTPACTIFVVGLLFIHHHDHFGLRGVVGHPATLYACTAALCYLLVAELPMFALKFKGLAWRGNEIKIIFAALSLGLLPWLGTAALAPIILLYVLLNAALHLYGHKSQP